jgi:hypothetical protein
MRGNTMARARFAGFQHEAWPLVNRYETILRPSMPEIIFEELPYHSSDDDQNLLALLLNEIIIGKCAICRRLGFSRSMSIPFRL